MKRSPQFAAAVGLLVIGGGALGQPASFTPLGDLPGGVTVSRARAVSGNGQFVAGESGSTASGSFFEACVWNGAGAPAPLGDLAGGPFLSGAYGVSNDGQVIIGTGTDVMGESQAFRWTPAGMTMLGTLPPGAYSSQAAGCGADGAAACGDVYIQLPSGGGPPPLPVQEPFRWTPSGGLVPLGFVPGVTGMNGGDFCTAKAISADGSVVAGYGYDSSGNYRPWRWTQATGIVDISGGGAARPAWARGCSPDGSVIVGNFYAAEPMAWTAAAGMRSIGLISGYTTGAAVDATSDGGRILGVMTGAPNLAAVWDRTLGMPLNGPTGGGTWRTIQNALAFAGVSTTGWNLTVALAMSDDGRTIIGYGVDPQGYTEAWKAVLPRACLADFDNLGGVTTQDIFAFLNAWFAGNPRSDFNGVDGITVQDIFDFLNAWFVGC